MHKWCGSTALLKWTNEGGTHVLSQWWTLSFRGHESCYVSWTITHARKMLTWLFMDFERPQALFEYKVRMWLSRSSKISSHLLRQDCWKIEETLDCMVIYMAYGFTLGIVSCWFFRYFIFWSLGLLILDWFNKSVLLKNWMICVVK